MKKKILLLSPPYHPDYMRNARCDFFSLSSTQWYPIWLGYCGCLLQKYGYKVKLLDALTYKLSYKKTTSIIENFNPDFIVIYSSRISKIDDIKYADYLKQKFKKEIVFVGPFVSIDPKEYLALSKFVKFAIRGEFDFPVLELVKGLPPQEIRNLLYKDEDTIKENPQRPLLTTQELDQFPFVSEFFYQQLDIKKYRAPSELHPFIDIMTGRGCVWGVCTFCLWVHSFIKGAVYNKRSIELVLDELEYISKNIPVKSVMIQDDTLPQSRAQELSLGILKRGIKIKWSCYARPNIDFKTLKLMKKAGCRNLHVGYESSNNEVLKKTAKGITFEEMIEFTYNAKRTGLNIHADFLMGLYPETRSTILKTIDWACKLDPFTAQFQIIIPYPCTPLYQQLKKKGYLNKEGQPHYPWLSNSEIRKLSKLAYRRFYFRWSYFLRTITHPYDRIIKRIPTFIKAIPAMFWRRWKV